MRRYRLLFVLLIIDVALVFAHIFLRQKLGFFNLDKEGSLKAAYSGLQLLLSGGAAVLTGFLLNQSGAGRRIFGIWSLVAASFLYLGVDEMMTIHERVGFVVNRWTGLTGYWGESFNWLLYFIPLIAFALIVYVLFVRMIVEEHRTTGIFCIVATLFFIASIVLEAIGGQLLGSVWYQSLIVLEEGSQLIGESLFLYAFVFLLRLEFERQYTLKAH